MGLAATLATLTETVLNLPLLQAALNLTVALSCGAVIGSERQVRRRMAGLRTNALVALGAAAFVTFSGLFPAEVSPTRVAAQIVSGIGFLGAGIIFRDGFTVHGLNTAATLWCAAAVGMMAGAGAWPHALLLTGLVVFVNLGLRPLVRWMKLHTGTDGRGLRGFRFVLTCATADEAAMRALLLRTLALARLQLSQMGATETAENRVILTAVASGEGTSDEVIALAVQRLAAEPGTSHLRWEVLEES